MVDGSMTRQTGLAIGASGAVLLGILFLGEPANLLRLTGIVVVLGGVLMLRLAEG